MFHKEKVMHNHDRHHHAEAVLTDDGRLASVFYWAIGLNMAYVILEAAFGFTTGSMGLLSDAGHNLTDVATLLIALLAYLASKRPATTVYSYGLGKTTVEASLVNAVILYVAVIFIAVESVRRLLHPSPVDGTDIAWVAGIGVVVNGVTAWLLMRHSHHDLNVKGAFLHMAADTLVSVGVVVSGIVITHTGWTWLDPVVGICIAALIAIGSWSLLRDSLRMSLDGVPAGVDIPALEAAILSVPEVKSMHHLHVWALSTTRTALTVHVIVESPDLIDKAISDVRDKIHACGISHTTIEAETSEHSCGESGLD